MEPHDEISPPPLRQLGLWKGQVWISPDFDDTDEELIRLFEGEEDNEDWSDTFR